MNSQENEPMLDVARGDRAMSEHLKNSLGLLREKSENPEFRRLVDDVVTGRASLRDVATSPAFTTELNPRVEKFAERYEQMSDAEHEELAAEGDRQFAERNEHLHRTQQPPARPADDEDDEDDGRSFLA